MVVTRFFAAACCYLALATGVGAQITIEASEVPQTVGDSFRFKYNQGTSTVDVGQPGGPHTWVFDTASYTGYVLTTTHVDPDSTPFPAVFPDAGIAMREPRGPMTLYVFRGLDTGQVTDYGFGAETEDTAFARVFSPPGVHIDLPATLGTSWQTAYSYTDTADDTTWTVYDDGLDCTVDGWGTIVCPSGTYPCLRVNYLTVEVRTTYVNGSPQWADTVPYRRYLWGSEYIGGAAVVQSMEDDTSTVFTQADLVMVQVYASTGAVAEAGPAPAVRGPGATVVRGVLPLAGGRPAELFDASGRKVMDLAPGDNDVRQLAPDVYFLRPEAGGPAGKVIVQR